MLSVQEALCRQQVELIHSHVGQSAISAKLMHHSELGHNGLVFFPSKKHLCHSKCHSQNTIFLKTQFYKFLHPELCLQDEADFPMKQKNFFLMMCLALILGGKGKISTCRVLGHTHETKQNWHSYVTSLLNCLRCSGSVV